MKHLPFRRRLLQFSMLMLGLGTTACVSFDPTRYQETKSAEDFGMSFIEIEGGVLNRASVFQGNQHTSSLAAYIYSWMGAYEVCAHKNQILLSMAPRDFSKEVQTTATGSTTSYVPNYDGSVTPVTSYYSYPVSHNFPVFATMFVCKKDIRDADLLKFYDGEGISRELVHPTTGDFHGGVLMKAKPKTELDPKYPVREGDVVTKIGTRRVESAMEIENAINDSGVDIGKVPVTIIRNKKLSVVQIPVKNESASMAQFNGEVAREYCRKLIENHIDSIPKVCVSKEMK